MVVLQDSDEWTAPLVLAAAADCDWVQVLVGKRSEVTAVGQWVGQLPHADRIRVQPARDLLGILPSLPDMKRLRSTLGPALGVTHFYVPVGLGAGWRRWLEGGDATEPPINVVEVSLPEPAVSTPIAMGAHR
jgi:hypothetical protein